MKEDKNKFIVIYVDDMIIAAPIEQLVDSVITRAQHFGIGVLGEPSRSPDCKLHRDK
jgi:hypothetical protein